uniref:Uncharacterized protein n=1 Tax=viral metagenome TaxID=1070528 RepID=A0A6M3K200_9ZZZZ
MEDNLREDVIVESCPMCGSNNYIFLFRDAPAYECFTCLNSFWIDDDRRLEFSLKNGIDIFEADHLLKNNLVPVEHGQCDG